MNKPQIRILIVEDDLVDRMACRRALAQDQNYEFVLTEAETGREGLQLAHEQKPDCVLLDYHLPDLDGLEFLAELRNDVGEITVPVMMLTGADNASVAVEALKRGAQDYLVKDSNRQYLELLPAVIQRVMRDRQTLKEKKQAEEDLVKAEAKYRFLVEQIPAITYTIAPNAPNRLLYISPQIGQLGFSPDEWLNDPEGLLKRIHPEDRSFVHDEIARGYESGEPLRFEYRLLTRAGEVRWFLNEASLVRDEAGEPLFLQGILVDITKDKEVEEELHLHRRRLEELVTNRTAQFEKQTAILKSANSNLANELGECTRSATELRKHADQLADFFEHAPCACQSLDTEGVVVQINEVGLKWLGRAREEVVGKLKLADLMTPASAKAFLENREQIEEGGWVRDLKIEIVRSDGNSLALLLSAGATRDADGRLIAIHSVIFEPERKRLKLPL